ncbi:THO complex subunit 7-like protein [Aphelenchoides avenae]|nr:THO complex subunit 7-like protein [Aphelenchus avenae]
MGDSEEAIVRKLVADGDGTGDDKRILQLFALVHAMANPADRKAAESKILLLLEQAEMSMLKQTAVAEMLELEEEKYRELFVDTEEQITQATEQMAQVKAELAKAKVVRKNRQEYDAIAKLISEIPSRSESQQSLETLRQEINDLQGRQKSLEQKLSERRKNIYALAVLLSNLSDCLEGKYYIHTPEEASVPEEGEAPKSPESEEAKA